MKKIFYLGLFFGMIYLPGMAQTAKETSNIHITNFTVYAKEAKLIIDWAVEPLSETNYFEVQRSSDGVQFTTVALVLGPDPRQSGERFQYVEKIKDNKIMSAYYRLRHVSADGKELLSKPVQPVK